MPPRLSVVFVTTDKYFFISDIASEFPELWTIQIYAMEFFFIQMDH
jgi:hypothetical protein